MNKVNPRDIIEGSRRMARQSRDTMVASTSAMDIPIETKNLLVSKEAQTVRMNLVMDCYNTGAAEMLKLIHGDSSPEPWHEYYDHEDRLRRLLDSYGLLGEYKTPTV